MHAAVCLSVYSVVVVYMHRPDVSFGETLDEQWACLTPRSCPIETVNNGLKTDMSECACARLCLTLVPVVQSTWAHVIQ